MDCAVFQFISRSEGDWTISVHPRHGSKDYHRRHVHISKKGLKGEYSWNEDCTRHDSHKFPRNEQYIKRAKELAASALGNVKAGDLHFITRIEGCVSIRVGERHSSTRELHTYIHKSKQVFVLVRDTELFLLVERLPT